MVVIGEKSPCLYLKLLNLILFLFPVEGGSERVAGLALGSQPRLNPPHFPMSSTNNLDYIPVAESMHYLTEHTEDSISTEKSTYDFDP